MYENTKIKTAYGAAISGIVAALFIAGITIVAELTPPLKDWLKVTFSHHWVGKSILAAGLFIILSFILALLPLRADEQKLRRVVTTLAWITITAALVIMGFFVYESA